mgnify:CR=1 FL=1
MISSSSQFFSGLLLIRFLKKVYITTDSRKNRTDIADDEAEGLKTKKADSVEIDICTYILTSSLPKTKKKLSDKFL